MKLLKPPLFVLALMPLVILIMQGLSGMYNTGPVLAFLGLDRDMGANPVEFAQHTTGDWILIFLCLTLAVTPLRKVTGQPWLIKFRRMLGLFAFFYACLHFLTYLWPDQDFNLAGMMKDVVKRPFIAAGFTGFALMIPLALTSTAASIRHLGGQRWHRLHKLIYISAIAGVVHYYWLVKSDVRKPLLFAAIVALLLGWRIAAAAKQSVKVTAKPLASSGNTRLTTAEEP